MSDAFIAREAAHARAMCRTALRKQVDQVRRDLGLPSVAAERRERMQQAFKNLGAALEAMGQPTRLATALAAVPKQEVRTHVE